MEIKEKPSGFWQDHVANNIGKDDITPEAWDTICKIRNRPIRLVRDRIVGEPNKPHIVIPKGYKGYLIDYPEAFHISDVDRRRIWHYSQTEYCDLIPASFFGYEEVVFLSKDSYEIIPQFFNVFLATYAEKHIINR